MGALEELQADYNCEMLFVESGGDNLAANYSRELADYIIYVSVNSACIGDRYTDIVSCLFQVVGSYRPFMWSFANRLHVRRLTSLEVTSELHLDVSICPSIEIDVRHLSEFHARAVQAFLKVTF